MKYRQKQNRGFTIVEVVVVLGITTIGLLGLMSLVLLNAQAQTVNKNHLIASMLAQEGIEYVRQIRDTNWKTRPGSEWATDIYNSSDQDFTIDKDKIDFSSSADTQLYMDANGFYSHDSVGTTPTLFHRKITSTSPDSEDPPSHIIVKSDVWWNTAGRESHYTIETELYNWR